MSRSFRSFAPLVRPLTPLRAEITAACRRPEGDAVAPLIEAATLSGEQRAAIRGTATRLVMALRRQPRGTGVEELVHEYALSSEEGVALMCLAEALLRIPDVPTRDALIRDKLAPGDWSAHLGSERSLFVNAASWSLAITGKLVGSIDDRGLGAALTRLVARAGEPVIRRGVDLAMRLMGEQFVAGETIARALARAGRLEAAGFRHSYDMLGEAAATAADAARYYESYAAAIHAIGAASAGRGVYEGPGVSIKLSALHPRYSRAQADRVMAELLPRLRALALLCKAYDIGLNIDAEEMDRLELSLDLLESLACDPALTGWDGLGFVVQAYGKRCPFVIDWLIDRARRTGRRLMVRLVKGAYWDTEIKRAQQDGLADFPVFTRKVHTDVAYIACARRLLSARDAVFPQFATHNAQTLATIHHLAGPDFAPRDYEFQCLHGMGEPLYRNVVGPGGLDRPCRIYAPVGSHETLLAYLVRRLLENGANSSFVHRIGDAAVPLDELVADPVDIVRALPHPGSPHEGIASPEALYPDRRNSAGLDLADDSVLARLSAVLETGADMAWHAGPSDRPTRPVRNPSDHTDIVGHVAEVDVAFACAAAVRAAASSWREEPVAARAARLERAADLLQERMPMLLGLLMREAGKTAASAVGEVREAIDFLRYYAAGARATFGMAQAPLGPVVCISPWNFPLAIFVGQVAAALVSGNSVLAKPAEETPLVAAEAVRLLHAAGVPEDALQLVPGDGSIGAALVDAPGIAAVLFTGSLAVARLIQRQLAGRLSAAGQPLPLIAETGGQNAMIVDSSALAEQVVADVLASAFDSAGQRCSALRILCLQEEIAEPMLAMLEGALHERRIGPTDRLGIDIGPVITADARDGIEAHVAAMRARGLPVTRMELPADCAAGTFVAPTIIEISRVAQVEREVFGPVLHVLRFGREQLDALVREINATGYGLTFGLHTRLDETIARVTARITAGNRYINRNMIGAVVGVQPFGGGGLSGTGPKAGGPLYLGRLVERLSPCASRPQQPAAPVLAFAEWLERGGEWQAAELARRYAAASALHLEEELPGPVGERNLYALHPRGLVLLCPATRAGLFEQLAAVLATGNRAFVRGLDLPPDLPRDIARAIAKGPDAPFAAALVEGGAERVIELARELAASEGPIVSVHAARSGPGLAYECHWLLQETVTTLNTAAVGGNASLMTLG